MTVNCRGAPGRDRFRGESGRALVRSYLGRLDFGGQRGMGIGALNRPESPPACPRP